MLYKILVITIALQHFAVIETQNRRFNVEFYTMTCDNFTKRVKLIECNFKRLATNRFAFSGHLMIDRDVDNEIELRIMLVVRPRYGKTSFNFIDIKINLCDALDTAFNSMLLKILMDEFRRSSNAPYSCPVKGDFLYKLENYTVTAKTLPPYTPLSNFNYSLEFYENSQLLGNFVAVGAVTAKP